MEIDKIDTLQEKYLDYKEKNDKFGMIHSLKNIGIKLSKTQPSRAVESFKKALYLMKNIQLENQDEELKVKSLRSEILFDIGIVYHKMRKNKKAIKSLIEADLLSKEVGNSVLTAAIASSIISIKSQERYDGVSRENRVKSRFKHMWLYFLLSVIPWIILIVLLFLII
ncbi:MAG: hypothetical protein GF329_22750 [Candidatus Lokiarchaeota archaeon]|nr:hypothetical protein [Candidatus Lokiarchaeota archaeon]